MAKLEIAYELALKDHVFVTEARFEGNLRGDVYDATMDELWEVETDQSERNLKKKLETRYPVQRVWIIDPNKDIKNQM
jgi:hypothetical protein